MRRDGRASPEVRQRGGSNGDDPGCREASRRLAEHCLVCDVREATDLTGGRRTGPDEHRRARLLCVKHLAELGHESIAFLGEPEEVYRERYGPR